MNHRTVVWAAFAAALLYISLPAQAQNGVQQLADRWVQAYNQHDRTALAGLYTERARLMMHGSPTIAGRDRIEEFWAGDFEEGNPLTLLTVTNSVNGSDMMLVHGDYKVISRDDGSKVGLGRFAHIWFRENGEWRLDRDLWLERSEPFELR